MTLPEEFKRPAPNQELVTRTLAELDRPLPVDYLTFMRTSNGGEGFIGEHYLVLWPLEDLVGANRALAENEDVRDVFWFGGDGGGEAFGFDWTNGGVVVEGPMIGMERQYLLQCADTFSAFLEHPTGFKQ
jgi:hypothetical protein